MTVLYSLLSTLNFFLKRGFSALREKFRQLHHLNDCPEHFALPRGVLPRRLFHKVGALMSTSVGACLSASTDALSILWNRVGAFTSMLVGVLASPPTQYHKNTEYISCSTRASTLPL